MHTLSGITTILWISDPFFVLLDLQIFFLLLCGLGVWGYSCLYGHSPLVAADFRFFSIVQLHLPIPHSPNDVVSCNSDH